ncbi:MAG TPA: glycosyltransferase family 4 protein [Anaerolineales bacterium]|nr:glycosyltransferase family 4 protein [Anaerolineales bacterium]
MKLGFIIYGSLDTLSGGYLYDRRLVEYLRARGDTVEVISLPWRNYAAHLMDNLHFRLPQQHGIARRRAAKQSPLERKLDILIQDELNHPSLVLANPGKHPYPVISLVHHLRCSELRPAWQNALYRAVEKTYLKLVDGFIFNSKTTRNIVHQLVGSAKPGIVAYPPTDRFGSPITEEEINERAQRQPLRILFLGNLIRRKGLHTLLEAILAKPSGLRVDVVGSLTSEPGYAKQIQQYITEHELSSFVFLHGPLDKEPLIEKLRQAHTLVVPSSYEGFGIVYLEGMCFGLPAIGTTAGAAGEVISDRVDGFLVEPGDVRSLADRLELLNQKRDLLVRMSLAARQRYLRQPGWDESAGQIREFLLKQIREFSV